MNPKNGMIINPSTNFLNRMVVCFNLFLYMKVYKIKIQSTILVEFRYKSESYPLSENILVRKSNNTNIPKVFLSRIAIKLC